MDVAESVNGVPIRLTDERWRHVVEARDELAGLYQQVLGTIEEPDAVVEGKDGALQAVRGGIMGRTVVVYREVSESDGFVITAWLTSRPERILRRRAIWTKPL